MVFEQTTRIYTLNWSSFLTILLFLYLQPQKTNKRTQHWYVRFSSQNTWQTLRHSNLHIRRVLPENYPHPNPQNPTKMSQTTKQFTNESPNASSIKPDKHFASPSLTLSAFAPTFSMDSRSTKTMPMPASANSCHPNMNGKLSATSSKKPTVQGPSPWRQLLPIAACMLSFATVLSVLIVYMDTTGE